MNPESLIKNVRDILGDIKEVNIVLNWLTSCFKEPKKFMDLEKAHYGHLIKSPHFSDIKAAILQYCCPEHAVKLDIMLGRVYKF